MIDQLTVTVSKCVSLTTRLLRLGAGGTWPGEIALTFSPDIFPFFSNQLRSGLILVAGTNGKTTTSLMITQILTRNGAAVIHNATGANLLNGVVSAFIQNADWLGNIKADWGVFEVDENSLPKVITAIAKQSTFSSDNPKKLIIVLLNLFRDQLDRYGEVDVIAEKWQKALREVPEATFIVNADDPLIAHLGIAVARQSSQEKIALSSPRNDKIHYFGIEDKTKFAPYKEHATDSTFCLNCGTRLLYKGVYFSHLGIWKCPKCGESRPRPDISGGNSPLPGLYNEYNTLAAVSVVKSLKYSDTQIATALKDFKPAFGRQEEFGLDGRKIKLFLSKNPSGFNASLRTVLKLNPKTIVLALNDRIPDGKDVSWIWDVDFELIPEKVEIIVSGDRAFDLGVRIKYSQQNETVLNPIVEPNLRKAIRTATKHKQSETIFVLATYSAMLEVRKILTGKKIL